MRTAIKNIKAKSAIIGALALFIALYGLFASKDLLLGPKLVVLSPKTGQTMTDSFVEVKGSAKRIAKIYLNGRQIFTDDAGNWDESLLLSYGYNIITVSAEDRFGRTVIKKLELVLK